MCGIAGFIQTQSIDSPEKVIGAMTLAIRHRGPDDHGYWSDPATGVALGHRRLSILDLSPLGHQPMESLNGRYVVVFNGEIYNFHELREELEKLGCHFKSRSDTEVLLAGISEWGIEKTLRAANGMFALALWDKAQKRLTLARDRLGKKPLYYGWHNGAFLFGSELKALKAHPAFSGEVNRATLQGFLQLGCVPGSASIYQNTFKLPPGTFIQLKPSDLGEKPAPRHFWEPFEAVRVGRERAFSGTADEAVSALHLKLKKAVHLRMISDVPLGAFLSGGIDSSIITALMQEQSQRPVQTYTIGFGETEYNEAKHAAAVAKHLGTQHTELYVSPEDARAVIPLLATMYDEPFADSSQIPTYLVAKLTRQHVTVALTGDGGDELFGGYNRHVWGEGIWNRIRPIPPPVRKALAEALSLLTPSQWEYLFSVIGKLAPSFRPSAPGDKVQKLADCLRSSGVEEIYRRMLSQWHDPERLVRYGGSPVPTTRSISELQGLSFTEAMMLLDLKGYLSDDVLTKVDRASMAVALECRAPFLDPEVVEFAWTLPLDYKVRNREGKWIIRQLLSRYIPQSMIDRPKMGFGVPIDSWLRGPLRDWAESLLSEERLNREGFLNPGPIRQKWSEHLTGSRNWQHPIWNVLMFQTWLEASR